MRRWTPALALLLAAGCTLEGAVGSNAVWQELMLRRPGMVPEVDILFVIDDSASMQPKQAEFARRFPLLLAGMQQLATNHRLGSLHIGVITTDLGAGPTALASDRCLPGGRGGRLAAVGAGALARGRDCPPLADGAAFLRLDLAGGRSNLPPGRSVAETFGCMADVGEDGCGFEQPLEAAWRALTDPSGPNAGFLRPSADLLVVFVTDEDDCSLDDPSEVIDPTRTDRGPLGSFRCASHGIVCNGRLVEPTPGAPLAGCRPATRAEGGKLVDLQKYIALFTRPAAQGGLKLSPAMVSLVALAGPPEPFQVIRMRHHPTGAGCAGEGCDAPALATSCQDPEDPAIFADPALRLAEVVAAVPRGRSLSLCDRDWVRSTGVMTGALGEATQGQCLAGLPVGADWECEVEAMVGDVLTPVPRCGNGDALCWTVRPDPACPTVTEAGRSHHDGLELSGFYPARARCRTLRLDR